MEKKEPLNLGTILGEQAVVSKERIKIDDPFVVEVFSKAKGQRSDALTPNMSDESALDEMNKLID